MKIMGKTLMISVCVAAAAVLVIVGIVFVRMSGSDETYRNVKVLETEGNASLARGEETMDVYEQLVIRGGDILSTGSDGRVDLSLDDDKYAIMESSSEVEFELEGEKDNGAIRLHLNAGAIYNEIENPISEGDSYEIETPDGVMAVRGTAFWVRIENDGLWRVTTIVVFEGSVHIQVNNTDREETLITAGEEAVIEKYFGDGEHPEEEARLRKSGGSIDVENLPDYLIERYGNLLTGEGEEEDAVEDSEEDGSAERDDEHVEEDMVENGEDSTDDDATGGILRRLYNFVTGSTDRLAVTGSFAAGFQMETDNGAGSSDSGTESDDTETGIGDGTGSDDTETQADDGTGADDTETETNNGTETGDTETNTDDETETVVELTKDDFSVDTSDQVYAGNAIEPLVSASNTAMKEGTDYIVSYAGNDGAGEAAITITGMGNYTGTLTYTFTIAKGTVEAPLISSVTYDGTQQTADVTDTALYEVTANECGTDVGSYSVVLTLTDSANYEWADVTESAELTLGFEIGQREVTLSWTAPESLVYDGTAKMPAVTLGNIIDGDVFDETVELSEGYMDGVDNVNAGCTFTFTVTELYNDNYCLPTDTLSPEYTITAKEISANDFSVDTSDQIYQGESVTPEVSLSEIADTDMEEGTDYTVSYADNDGAGEATITITGKGNYTGTLTYTFTIIKGTVEVPSIGSVTYDGTQQTADVTDTALYEVTANEGGTDAGSYSVVLTLTDSTNYEWADGTEGAELTLDFEIGQREVTLAWTAPKSLVYDGSAKMPTVTLGNIIDGDVFDETVELSEGYTDGEDNVNAGCTFTCTVTELYNDNYCLPPDTASPEYTITEKEISMSDFTVDTSDQTYQGETVTPEVSLSETADTDMEEGIDYTVFYADNDGVGEAIITITGMGNYMGTLTYTFTIIKGMVEVPSIGTVTYDGTQQTADVTDTALYEVTANEGGTDAGSYSVVLTLTDSANYEWADGTEGAERTLDFEIGQREVTLTWTAPESLVYDGSTKMPMVTLGNVLEGDSIDETVELSEGYTDGVDNVNAGCTFTCTVTKLYNDNYCLPSDRVSPEYTITEKEISMSDFTVDTSDQTYQGETVTPEVSLSETADTAMEEGTDYTVSYAGNDGAGEATITITGKGNYTGTLTYSFTIIKGTVEVPSIEIVTYDGTQQTADLTDTALYAVTANEGGTDVGSYSVVLTLTDSTNYEWADGTEGAELTLDFEIGQREVTLSWTAPESLVYDGTAKMPAVTLGNIIDGDVFDETVELSEGYTDGIDNVNAGCTFTCTVTELYNDNYCLPTDTVSPEYTITAREISGSDFALSAVDGEDGITVTVSPVYESMTEGKDYTWSFRNEDWIITITGMGNCTGTLTFSIVETPDGYDFIEQNGFTQDAGLLFLPFVLGEVFCYAKRKKERKKGI